jgi:hypothetical protein
LSLDEPRMRVGVELRATEKRHSRPVFCGFRRIQSGGGEAALSARLIKVRMTLTKPAIWAENMTRPGKAFAVRQNADVSVKLFGSHRPIITLRRRDVNVKTLGKSREGQISKLKKGQVR